MTLRVTHVITDLDTGGAETVLYRLLRHTDPDRIAARVVCLSGPGPYSAPMTELGIPVDHVGMRPGRLRPRDLGRLRAAVAEGSPDVVQTWMYHADLLGGIAGLLTGAGAVVWGVHQTDLPAGKIPWSTRAIAWVNARLSGRLPDRIVCCSRSAQRAHLARGYPADKLEVIPNGFEVAPLDPAARGRIRAELGVGTDDLLVGRIGRFHPQKDHRTFLIAGGLVARRHPTARFVLCGAEITPRNRTLQAWVRDAGLEGQVHLLGPRGDVRAIHEALDLAVSSSSFGEALPLVIGEAMERAVPVVATDVGDSALLVGGCGRIVRPRDPSALSRAMADVLAADRATRRELGAAARRRIADRYPLTAMVDRYTSLHASLARRPLP